MVKLKQCPICNDENIIVSFNPTQRRFIISCNNCEKDYTLSKKFKPKCPKCNSETIYFEEDETYCYDCGTVLSATSEYVGITKIILDWGIQL